MALPNEYKEPVLVAIIGGTGLGKLPSFTPVATLEVETPWGRPSAPISIFHHEIPGSANPLPVAFLSRHGLHHEYAPHEVPARANIAALRSIGVRSIIAFSAVGSLKEEIKPRDFVLPDQIIDRTKGVRPWTFFEGGMVGHVGFGDPFDAGLSGMVKQSAGTTDVTIHEDGLLICMGKNLLIPSNAEGPQFSTRAESKLYRSWGGSVINMSALPEAKLAREAEIAYQMICMSTDYDSWHETNEAVTVEMVMGNMKANATSAGKLAIAVLNEISKDKYSSIIRAKHLEGQSKGAASMTAAPGRKVETVQKLKWLFPGYFD
ncbi:MAG: S-methyl-5-thioadenosine phosphorylase [Vezdaea aestivalis]|nr:MAG: S-methyl-5-thioadenosine phosphorylase [Vezdaea aestivalis]